MQKKRVLWLLNHDTLSKFELPLLDELGFEIYTPKIVPEDILEWSGSVTYEYDKTLSIPDYIIEKLNNTDFYHGDISLEVKKILNKYFEIAFCFFEINILEYLIHNFEGYIFLRAFGMDRNRTYSDTLKKMFSKASLYKLNQIKDRFWFSQCYDNLADVEYGAIKEKAVYMPLGLPNEYYNIENKWTGKINKLLFFCSRINVSPPYKKIYKDFVHNFKNFDYVIAGNQPIDVDDKNVLGYLERDKIEELYINYKVMYYHSTEPRHLHYHPLEAMIAGMPVIYMKSGLLDKLGGKYQPGKCSNITTAKLKIKRILDNDKELIDQIRKSEKDILYKFSLEYNKKVWKENFCHIVENKRESFYYRSKGNINLAIFLSSYINAWNLNYYKNIILVLYNSIKKINVNNKVTVGVIDHLYDINNDFRDLIAAGIDIREMNFKMINKKEVIRINNLTFYKRRIEYDYYLLPIDNIKNFMEADYWLFLQKDFTNLIAPVKPYGIYIDNLLSRYTEQESSKISPITIQNIRKADFIFTSNLSTYNDILHYLGVNKERISLLPYTYAPLINNMNFSFQSQNYLLIILDPDNEQQNIKFLNKIEIYYGLFKGHINIKIILSELSKDYSNSAAKELRKRVKEITQFKNRVQIYGYMNEYEYLSKILYSKYVMVPGYPKSIEPDILSCIYYNKKLVVNENPFIKYISEFFDYNFIYINFENTQEVVNMIKEIESSSIEFKKNFININNIVEPENINKKIKEILEKLL